MTDNTDIFELTRGRFLNKKCKIQILKNGIALVFTGLILIYTEREIIFTDKYNKLYCFSTSLLQEIREVQNE